MNINPVNGLPCPEKGSPEAMAWKVRMHAARKEKAARVKVMEGQASAFKEVLRREVPADKRENYTGAMLSKDRAVQLRHFYDVSLPELRSRIVLGKATVKELEGLREMARREDLIVALMIKDVQMDLLHGLKKIIEQSHETFKYQIEAIRRANDEKRDAVILEEGYRSQKMMHEMVSTFAKMQTEGFFNVAKVDDNSQHVHINAGGQPGGDPATDALLARAVRGLGASGQVRHSGQEHQAAHSNGSKRRSNALPSGDDGAGGEVAADQGAGPQES